MKIEYLGHSAFNIISENGLNILIDPFISNNPSASVSVESLHPDIILVTHGHFDHFGDTFEIANNNNSLVVTNYALAGFLNANNIDSIGMNIGGLIKLNDDLSIRMVKAEHSSEFDLKPNINGGVPAGFIITLENNKKIYHAGDTALFSDMKNIIGNIYKPDISLLPIGDKYTMGVDDAAIASNWLNSKVVIPMHYNTYLELKQDTNYFKKTVSSKNKDIDVIVLKPGEHYSY